jgi:hypothetical protein
MSEAPDPAAEVVAPVAEPEIPAAEAPEAAPAPEPAPEGEAPAGEAPEVSAEPEEPKKPKSPVAQLQGRVGYLTKTLHDRDSSLADQKRQLDAYKALLEGQGKTVPEGEEAPKTAPRPDAPDFATAVRAEATRIAADERFTADCNSIFEAGQKAHGDEFKEAVTNLNVLGLMQPALVEAAMVTDTPADVIHYLGTDVDEAARIMALPPIRMAAELVKLSGKLAAPTAGTQVSRAPAPITPIGGAVKPEIDISDPNQSMSAYVAARKAMGSRWAR